MDRILTGISTIIFSAGPYLQECDIFVCVWEFRLRNFKVTSSVCGKILASIEELEGFCEWDGFQRNSLLFLYSWTFLCNNLKLTIFTNVNSVSLSKLIKEPFTFPITACTVLTQNYLNSSNSIVDANN